jgi:hypothetical protein
MFSLPVGERPSWYTAVIPPAAVHAPGHEREEALRSFFCFLPRVLASAAFRLRFPPDLFRAAYPMSAAITASP